MAQVISGSQVKLQNGQTINAQQGGWYDGQQFWGGTLSAPGVINSQSSQQGAGQAVSNEVIAQTNPANVAYIQQQQAAYKPSATSQPMPSSNTAGNIPGGTSGAGIGFQAPQDTFDPTKFYETAYNNSGIRNLEADLTAKSNAHNEAVAKIKDNPYLSEATMTGRIKKLDEKFDADNQTAQNDIAMKKADVETQLNLQLKKLDINNAATKMAMDQFNTLLASGALSGANGQDIANITRATGISSNMIQSAISSQKAKDVKTNVIPFDDGTNQGFAVINERTGEIINKQNVAASKPAAAKQATEAEQKAYYLDRLRDVASSGAYTVPDIFRLFSGYVDPNQILSIYNSNSIYGPATEDKKLLKSYGVTF
jgi:hypothetical protein